MRRKLAGLALGLAAMAMLALSGCGAMTPEKLAGKIRQAVKKTPCSQMEMDMVVDMTMAEPTSGIETDLGIRMAGQMQMSYDPDTAYENLEVTVEMMDIRMPANMEIYVLQEGASMSPIPMWRETGPDRSWRTSSRQGKAAPLPSGICPQSSFPLTRK